MKQQPTLVEHLDVRVNPDQRTYVNKVLKGHNRDKGSKYIPNTYNTSKYREPQKPQ